MAKSLKQLRYEYTQILESENKNLREQLEAMNRLPSLRGQGAVYVVRQVGSNNYKIGHTTNYDQRKYQFDVRLPFEIEEIYVYQTEHYRLIEQRVHELLKPHRLNRSEFFELTEKQIDILTDEIIRIETEIIESNKVPESFVDDENLNDPNDEMRDRIVESLPQLKLEGEGISTSFLQRKFGLGYSRAARIIDSLESDGMIGPSNGAKKREILID